MKMNNINRRNWFYLLFGGIVSIPLIKNLIIESKIVSVPYIDSNFKGVCWVNEDESISCERPKFSKKYTRIFY